MDSRLVMNGCGCVYNDNDQQPIDIRFSLPLSGTEFPTQKRVTVGAEWVKVRPGDVPPPHYVTITNMTGTEIASYPDDATKAAIARSVLEIAFADLVPRIWLHAPRVGEDPMGGVAALQLIDGQELWMRARNPDAPVSVRYMVAG
jgi:hypothetical protein